MHVWQFMGAGTLHETIRIRLSRNSNPAIVRGPFATSPTINCPAKNAESSVPAVRGLEQDSITSTHHCWHAFVVTDAFRLLDESEEAAGRTAVLGRR